MQHHRDRRTIYVQRVPSTDSPVPIPVPRQLQMPQLSRVPETHFSSPVLPQRQTSLRLQVKAGLQDTPQRSQLWDQQHPAAEGISTDQSIFPTYLPLFLHQSRSISSGTSAVLMSYGSYVNFQLNETRQRAAPAQTDPPWLETISGDLTMSWQSQLLIREPAKFPFPIRPHSRAGRGTINSPACP